MIYIYLIFTLIILVLLFSIILLKKRIQELEKKRKMGVGETDKDSGLKGYSKEQQERKKGRKERIVKLLEEKDRITNNDVEELLGVSDATATNYLDELEKEGKIEQFGRTGRSVYYKLITS